MHRTEAYETVSCCVLSTSLRIRFADKNPSVPFKQHAFRRMPLTSKKQTQKSAWYARTCRHYFYAAPFQLCPLSWALWHLFIRIIYCEDITGDEYLVLVIISVGFLQEVSTFVSDLLEESLLGKNTDGSEKERGYLWAACCLGIKRFAAVQKRWLSGW